MNEYNLSDGIYFSLITMSYGPNRQTLGIKEWICNLKNLPFKYKISLVIFELQSSLKCILWRHVFGWFKFIFTNVLSVICLHNFSQYFIIIAILIKIKLDICPLRSTNDNIYYVNYNTEEIVRQIIQPLCSMLQLYLNNHFRYR